MAMRVRGETVAEIAAGNGVAQPTVRNQIREIFAKTGVRTRAQAIVRARDLGYGQTRS